MQLVRADSDFRSESELSAVGEPGGGIDINRSGVDFIQEFFRMLRIVRQDAVAVS